MTAIISPDPKISRVRVHLHLPNEVVTVELHITVVLLTIHTVVLVADGILSYQIYGGDVVPNIDNTFIKHSFTRFIILDLVLRNSFLVPPPLLRRAQAGYVPLSLLQLSLRPLNHILLPQQANKRSVTPWSTPWTMTTTRNSLSRAPRGSSVANGSARKVAKRMTLAEITEMDDRLSLIIQEILEKGCEQEETMSTLRDSARMYMAGLETIMFNMVDTGTGVKLSTRGTKRKSRRNSSSKSRKVSRSNCTICHSFMVLDGNICVSLARDNDTIMEGINWFGWGNLYPLYHTLSLK